MVAAGGALSTRYVETTPVTTCARGVGGATIRTETKVTVWLDASHRIRQIQQGTFEQTRLRRGGPPTVTSFTSTLTFTRFGIPVTIATPAGARGGGNVVLTPGHGTCGRVGWVAYAPLSNGATRLVG